MSKRVLVWIFTGVVQAALADNNSPKQEDVSNLNIEELVNVQVTSVSKKTQALSDAPAAIFVISRDDIERSGATSVPEVLRMAPGIEVARISSSKWAVSARGFNGSFANKLLVLIDGRSVYTPMFSGVYWDAQDVLMEDVERIEVIRGPGATLWGANAVNGVINIITKHTDATQGGQLVAGGGTLETGFASLRYGKKIGENTYARAYVKGFRRDQNKTPNNHNGADDWHKQQAGFRMDTRLTTQDEFTLQGDAYYGKARQLLLIPTLVSPFAIPTQDLQEISGWNITSKLLHTFSSTSAAKLQIYYDRYNRNEYTTLQHVNNLDIDFQHNFQLTDRHNIIWGLDYRYTWDNISSSYLARLNPSSRDVQLFSGFVQDEMMLVDETLWLTLGSKFEHNDYTGFEGQPTAKLMWAPSARQRVWASVSRAVRIPSRGESAANLHQLTVPPSQQTFNLPVAVIINGNPNFRSEVLLAYELGYRFTFDNTASLDLTAFYNDYDELRGANIQNSKVINTPSGSHIEQNFIIDNKYKGHTYGVEMAAVWQMNDWWRWDASYSFLNMNIAGSENSIGSSPHHKISLRAGLNPLKDVNFDVWLRYTSDAKAFSWTNGKSFHVPDYVTMDIRVAWQPLKSMELSLTGQNLLDSQHLEYVEESYACPVEISRGIYGKLTWQF
jgi:iron complex outermembrane recepter protein